MTRLLLPDRPLVLRTARPEDAGALAAFARANRDRFGPWLPLPPDAAIDAWAPAAIAESARSEQRGTDLRLMLFSLPDERRIVGHVMLTRIDRSADPASMLSYAIDRDLEGTGAMVRAVERVIDHAFGSLHVSSIGARYRTENARSERLLTRLGFGRERRLEAHPWLSDDPGAVLAVLRDPSAVTRASSRDAVPARTQHESVQEPVRAAVTRPVHS